jgi:hypothetical protein
MAGLTVAVRKNGVASPACAIHRSRQRTEHEDFSKKMDCRVEPGNDARQ